MIITHFVVETTEVLTLEQAKEKYPHFPWDSLADSSKKNFRNDSFLSGYSSFCKPHGLLYCGRCTITSQRDVRTIVDNTPLLKRRAWCRTMSSPE